MVYRDKEYRKCTCAREIDIAPIKQDDERGEHCSRDYQTCGYSNYADIFFPPLYFHSNRSWGERCSDGGSYFALWFSSAR
jgi:hypothetical protein